MSYFYILLCVGGGGHNQINRNSSWPMQETFLIWINVWKNWSNKTAWLQHQQRIYILILWFTYTKPTYFQYFGSSLESLELLSADVRGTFENSESEASDCSTLPWENMELGFGFTAGFNLEKPEAAPTRSGIGEDPGKFGLLCGSPLGAPVTSTASLLSLSSVSLRRKSTHRSAKDWKISCAC